MLQKLGWVTLFGGSDDQSVGSCDAWVFAENVGDVCGHRNKTWTIIAIDLHHVVELVSTFIKRQLNLKWLLVQFVVLIGNLRTEGKVCLRTDHQNLERQFAPNVCVVLPPCNCDKAMETQITNRVAINGDQ